MSLICPHCSKSYKGQTWLNKHLLVCPRRDASTPVNPRSDVVNTETVASTPIDYFEKNIDSNNVNDELRFIDNMLKFPDEYLENKVLPESAELVVSDEPNDEDIQMIAEVSFDILQEINKDFDDRRVCKGLHERVNKKKNLYKKMIKNLYRVHPKITNFIVSNPSSMLGIMYSTDLVIARADLDKKKE